MDKLEGRVLMTGGAGTLGTAIIRRATQEKWNCDFTVFSRDAAKHAILRSVYPHVRTVMGDIRDAVTLYNVMLGHDIVIHAAAVKRIPEGELNSIDTYEINVGGSLNVAQMAIQLGIPRVIAISTDKACHAANAYGAAKYLMEKIWQEHSRLGLPTQFHLVRYGNVLESSGSVIEAWKKSQARGESIQITNPYMTRFWLSPAQAVELVLKAMDLESGHIYVAKMPALSIGKLAAYVLGDYWKNWVQVPLRPGEKAHETLLTQEELDFATNCGDYFDLRPTTSHRNGENVLDEPYSSDIARELTKEELDKLLAD